MRETDTTRAAPQAAAGAPDAAPQARAAHDGTTNGATRRRPGIPHLRGRHVPPDRNPALPPRGYPDPAPDTPRITVDPHDPLGRALDGEDIEQEHLRIAVDPHEPRGRALDRNSRIAVDFDGVLFDHVPYLLRGFRDAHGIDLEAEGFRHWDFFQYRAVRERNLTWNCVRKVLRAIETDPMLHLEPPRDPYARAVMQAWRDLGHEVCVVTARDPESREVTELFLETHDIPHDRLVMGASRKTGYDLLVDDAPHNVLMAAADGGFALLMDHPYNRDVPAKGNPVRVRDWRDVAALAGAPPRKVTA